METPKSILKKRGASSSEKKCHHSDIVDAVVTPKIDRVKSTNYITPRATAEKTSNTLKFDINDNHIRLDILFLLLLIPTIVLLVLSSHSVNKYFLILYDPEVSNSLSFSSLSLSSNSPSSVLEREKLQASILSLTITEPKDESITTLTKVNFTVAGIATNGRK